MGTAYGHHAWKGNLWHLSKAANHWPLAASPPDAAGNERSGAQTADLAVPVLPSISLTG